MLDLLAAQAVVRARLLERAVHDLGPWSIRIGDAVVFAIRIRTPSRVVFLSHFDEVPSGDCDVAWLLCRGEAVSSREIGQATGPFSIEWSLDGPISQSALV